MSWSSARATRSAIVVALLVASLSWMIWFAASGMNPAEDPYYLHAYRINFDGTGLTPFTEANGTHTVTFSPDSTYYVDSWSRVDQAPIAQLRRTSDQKVVMELERGDLTELEARIADQSVNRGHAGL